MKTYKTKTINVGRVKIGSGNKIAIQSMTNTKTSNIKETIAQVNELFSKGCDIVRVSVADIDDANALAYITRVATGPIVADIHFDYKLALLAIDNGISKLRLNPGNITNSEHIKLIVDKCKERNIPIRIGVNSGSINKEIYKKYGNTPKALVESAKEHVKILEDLGFYDIVISVKASSVVKTIEAYTLLAEEYDYPLHLGVTEAGLEYSGLVKSSVALGSLLLNGIGDTIRVSLTDDPVKEVKAAIEILSSIDKYDKPKLISCPTCGRCEYNMMPIANEINEYINTLNGNFSVAVMGCVVNGPGEAKEANVGIAGGKDCAVLFKDGEVITKLASNEIIPVLKKEIYMIANNYRYMIENKLNSDIIDLRNEVFVEEQGFTVEFDEYDSISKYAVIYHDENVIGVGRIYEDAGVSHIGRICVKKAYRKNKIGSLLLMLLERYAKYNIELEAQDRVSTFYEKIGYTKTNHYSYEDGVKHVKMIKKINR